MNLATRCLSCDTVFRVAEAQLLASDGWVRCGRCNGVFNAAEVLFDVDTGAPMRLALPPDQAQDQDLAPGPDPAARQAPHFNPPPPARAYPDEPLLRAPSRSADDEPDEPIFISDHVPPPAAAQPDAPADLAPVGRPGAPLGDGPSLAPATTPAAAAAVAAATTAAINRPAAAPAPPSAMPVQTAPSFLRQAERTAMWRHPRGGLWAGVLLLGLAALLQMALLWRDNLAAHLPRTAPALQALCRLAGCSVLPLRRIGLLSVDSSGLNRLEGSSLYRLQLVLRNRADTAVMVPALDLTLTDPQGQLLARRVLPVAALGVPQAVLQAGQELPIKVLVSTGERRVEGYTLEIFYP